MCHIPNKLDSNSMTSILATRCCIIKSKIDFIVFYELGLKGATPLGKKLFI